MTGHASSGTTACQLPCGVEVRRLSPTLSSRLSSVSKDREGLATDRPVCAMRAADGTILEVFEWKSQEAIAAAHQNAAVQALWQRYQEACEYVPLSTVAECQQMFAGFHKGVVEDERRPAITQVGHA